MAAIQAHADIVTMLLDAGAVVSAVNSDGIHALTAGVQKGSCDVIKILLERGANVNHQCLTMVLLCTWPHNRDLMILLNVLIAAGADINHAVALLRAGANVLARDKRGTSPLHTAARRGNTDVIEVLLAGGGHSDVNFEDNEHHTPLSLASQFADVKAVNLLLDAGADVNQLDAHGRTALFFPSDLKIVKALIDRGADVKVINKEGESVLHSAGYSGADVAVICALFKAGADPTVKNEADETAADLARDEGHEDAAKLLDLLAAKYRAMRST